jgi:hypothetical protein
VHCRVEGVDQYVCDTPRQEVGLAAWFDGNQAPERALGAVPERGDERAVLFAVRGLHLAARLQFALDELHGLVGHGPAHSRQNKELGGLEPLVRCDIRDQDAENVVG